MSNQPQMSDQPQKQPNTLSRMDMLLDKLCSCGPSQQEQVFYDTESAHDNDYTWNSMTNKNSRNSATTTAHALNQIQTQEQLRTYYAAKQYGRFSQYCAASTPLITRNDDEEPSIRRKDTPPIHQNTTNKQGATTSGRVLDSTRLFASSLPGDGLVSYFNEQDDEENSIREPSARDLCESPSLSSSQDPPEQFKIPSFTKYPNGPPPIISPTDTQSTVSLSDSTSIMTSGSSITETIPTRGFQFTKRQQQTKTKECCPTMRTEDEVEHEAYGFLLRMKPQNYSQVLEGGGELDDSQYYYSNGGGVTFQPPTKLSNGITDGSLWTNPTQHTVQARTA